MSDPTNSFFSSQNMQIGIIALLVFVIILLLVLISYLLRLSKTLFQTEEEKAYEKAFKAQGIWERMFGLNPLEYEEKMILDHSYDEIKELNNPTPPWFNLLFYGTIGFAIVYLLYFHVFDQGYFQDDEYKIEVAEADAKRTEILKKYAASINEENVTLLTDAKGLADGKELFGKYCVACHGKEAQGGVGPNLVDNYWLHGAEVKEIFKTITYGVPQKGMISWQKQLNPLQIQQLSSYIVSIRGTTPANPKKPEGVLVGDTTSAKAPVVADSTKSNI